MARTGAAAAAVATIVKMVEKRMSFGCQQRLTYCSVTGYKNKAGKIRKMVMVSADMQGSHHYLPASTLLVSSKRKKELRHESAHVGLIYIPRVSGN